MLLLYLAGPGEGRGEAGVGEDDDDDDERDTPAALEEDDECPPFRMFRSVLSSHDFLGKSGNLWIRMHRYALACATPPYRKSEVLCVRVCNSNTRRHALHYEPQSFIRAMYRTVTGEEYNV